MTDREVVEIAKQIGVEQGLWFYFTSLVDIYNKLNQMRKASNALGKATTLIKKSRSHSARGWLHYYLGIDRLRHGSVRSAHINIVKCRKIAESTGSREMKISASLMEGEIYFRKKEYSQAVKHINKALKISYNINRVEKQVESHITLRRTDVRKSCARHAACLRFSRFPMDERNRIRSR